MLYLELILYVFIFSIITKQYVNKYYLFIYLFLFFLANYLNLSIVLCLIIFTSIFIMIVDIHLHIISDFGLIMLFLTKINNFRITSATIIPLGLIIIYFLLRILNKEIIGFGDLKILLIISINQELFYFIGEIFFSLIITLIIFLIKRTKKIPYGPGILISYLFFLK